MNLKRRCDAASLFVLSVFVFIFCFILAMMTKKGEPFQILLESR